MSLKANEYSIRQTFKAASNVKTTTAQFAVAYISASMTVSVASAAADDAVGIIEDCPSATCDNVSVIMHGIATGKMLSGTTVAIGDWLSASTFGSLIVALTTTTANQKIVGRALDVPASGGAVTIFVNICPGGTLV